MKTSEKLGLWLPEGSDPLEVSKLSENFETLDPLGSGVEILKEGSGVGGLFMVSKYYDQPIENALLCNGGTFNGDVYPELSNLLGVKYGGSYSLSNVPSAYNIPSSVKPIGYNAKHDCFIGNFVPANHIITIYKKNTAPQTITLSSTQPLARCSCAYAYDDYFLLIGSYVQSTSHYKKTVLINLQSMSEVPTTGAYRPPYALLSTSQPNTMTIMQKDLAIAASTVSLKTEPLRFNTVNPGSVTAKFLRNYDSDDSKVYMYTVVNVSGSYTITIFYASYSEFLSALKDEATNATNIDVSDISTAVGSFTVSNSAAVNPNSLIIRNNYVVLMTSAYIYMAPIKNNSIGSVVQKNVTTGVWTSPPIRLSDNVDLFFSTYAQQISSPTEYTPKHRYLLIDYSGGTITEGPSSVDVYQALFDGSEQSMICTDAGAKTDAKISGQKVPNITMSESLVYIRTKGA